MDLIDLYGLIELWFEVVFRLLRFSSFTKINTRKEYHEFASVTNHCPCKIESVYIMQNFLWVLVLY